MMMDEKLKPLEGYLISIVRDTVNGWYFIEMGLPKDWSYDSNDIIVCDVINEDEVGRLLKISPKISEVTIDNLIQFATLLIETNMRVAERERKFQERLKEMKRSFEEETASFYQELEDLKKSSFNDIGEKLKEIRVKGSIETPKKNVGRPKKTGVQETPNTIIDSKDDDES